MEATQEQHDLINKVTAAMQAGPAGEEDMLALFTSDAVLIEPFGGQPQTSEGIEAVRIRYHEMVNAPRPPDFLLIVDSVWAEGGQVMTDWTCTSVVLPAPMKGRSTYTIQGDKISRLEIAFV